MSGEEWVRALVGPSEVVVHAPKDAVAELADLVAPFVRIEPCDGAPPAGGASRTPAVLVRRTPPEGGSWRRVALSSEYEPDRVLWVDDERRHIAVVGAAGAWRSQQLLRSVRHLLKWQAYARGDLFLHGGLVRARHRGIAFLGGKRSGKTSSLLSAVLNGAADLVSNDDVVVTDTPSGLLGYGSPRTVNIRTDSLLALAESAPGFTGLLHDSSHPTNGFEGRHRTQEAIATGEGAKLPGSVWVRCAEISRVTGCELLPAHRIDAVVFPRFDGSAPAARLTPLDRESAVRMLRENLEPSATKYDPFLADWFPDTDGARRELLLQRLADDAVFYQLAQNMGRLEEGTRLVLDALDPRDQPA